MPQAVTDYLSNTNEHIMEAARSITYSQAAREVFIAIHKGKRAVKTVPDLATATGLSEKTVLTHGKRFVKLHLIEQLKVGGRIAYRKNQALQANIRKIVSLADSRAKRREFPTKRQVGMSITIQKNGRNKATPRAIPLTIDDIDSFKAVKNVKPDGYIPRTVSEDQFKRGVQAILSERAEWKDWGGELADLVSTRVVLKGQRIGTVFAFKGPAMRGALVPGKMGKNGDQIQRMYILDGRLFVVQYVGEIKPSINQLMRSLAVDKSAATGDTIYYAVIDGIDSYRIIRAYPDQFQ